MCNNLIAISFYKQNPLWGSLNMNYSVVGEASVLSSILKIKKTPVHSLQISHTQSSRMDNADPIHSCVVLCACHMILFILQCTNISTEYA